MMGRAMRQRSTSLSSDQSAQAAAVREACKRVAPEFLPVTAFLPPAKRLAARAVMAFCGMVREAVWAVGAQPSGSSCGSSGNLLESGYALLLDRIDELYSKPNATSASGSDGSQQVLGALANAIRRYQIPKECFLNFAEGIREDVTTRRYATWSALRAHCQRTGGSVALALIAVLGLSHSAAGEQVGELGTAIRLMRLLCDARGRMAREDPWYLPLEDLARFKVSQKELAAPGASTERFGDLMRFEVSRARNLFREGSEAICWIAGDGSRFAASLAAVQAAWALRSAERRGHDGLRAAAARPRAKFNLRVIEAALRLARRKSGKPLPNLFGT
jgi:phytoene/squalene synthetase